jgi:hypothetical protein
MHREYTVRAAQAGVHVLCEKPMAVTEEECQEMIDAAEQHRVKLMIAYRLHFEEANLKAVELIKEGQIGEPLPVPDLIEALKDASPHVRGAAGKSAPTPTILPRERFRERGRPGGGGTSLVALAPIGRRFETTDGHR